MPSKFKGAKPKPANFGKTAEPPLPASPNKLSPQFSFEFMRPGSGYSVSCCNEEHKAALAARLYMLSQKTWQEIQNAPRHGIGSEKISRNSLNVPVPSKVPEDADLIALRYHGMSPIIGFRDGRVFHLIFMDHDFTVYRHG